MKTKQPQEKEKTLEPFDKCEVCDVSGKTTIQCNNIATLQLRSKTICHRESIPKLCCKSHLKIALTTYFPKDYVNTKVYIIETFMPLAYGIYHPYLKVYIPDGKNLNPYTMVRYDNRPVMLKVSQNINTSDYTDCSICLNKLTNENCYKISACGHMFHADCAINWFNTKGSKKKCPICRKSVM
jgi:hypothetical protein